MMIERLGLVIYWLACAVALLPAGLAAVLLVTDSASGPEAYVILLVLAAVIWLVGRTVLYVFTGR